tara:strand:- start:1352 stop:1711 length:360 start_codon:yes stop_codon:yes gene_type:complete
MTKSVDEMLERADKKEEKVNRFCDLLDSLETTEDKKKHLWKEIYENAINDRENASILFTDLLMETKGNGAQHAVFGPIMSKYLERMCKSNDQILKLAEMIGKEDDKAVDVNSIFDKIRE